MTKFLKRALVMEILAAQDTETKQFLSLRYEQPYIPTGKKAKKREQIINEIVDSEKVYL